MNGPTDNELAAMLSISEPSPESIVPGVLVQTALADQYLTVPGPLGLMHVAFTTSGISSIVPTGDEQEFLQRHAQAVGRPAYPTAEMPHQLEKSLQRSVETGKLGNLPVDMRQLTSFQREVLEVTAQIPPGEVRPYNWVAREMGSAGAVRAVGSALARNPLPIVVPCHRVVKSDGSVGNYAFGRQMKEDLLTHEGMDRALLRSGSLRYVGSDTTGIFCFPTCRHARRITTGHRVEFRTTNHAEADGYRACKVCRPTAN